MEILERILYREFICQSIMVKSSEFPENNLFTVRGTSTIVDNLKLNRKNVGDRREQTFKKDLFVSENIYGNFSTTNSIDKDRVRITSLLNPIKIQSSFERRISESKIGILVIGKNETNTIKDVLSDITLTEQSFPGGFIKVFIDDGSTDDTLSKAMNFDFTIFQHSKSLGIGGAIKSGYYFFKKYRPEIIVQIDSDGEHPVASIPDLINAIKNNNLDVAIGSRYYNGNLPNTLFVKILGVKLLSLFFKLISPSYNISDVVSGFRAFRSNCLDNLFFISEKNWAIEFAIRAIKKKRRIGDVPVKYSFRRFGHSQFRSPRSYLKYGINVFRQLINSINDDPEPLFKILK